MANCIMFPDDREREQNPFSVCSFSIRSMTFEWKKVTDYLQTGIRTQHMKKNVRENKNFSGKISKKNNNVRESVVVLNVFTPPGLNEL